jgi:hypothetical protein
MSGTIDVRIARISRYRILSSYPNSQTIVERKKEGYSIAHVLFMDGHNKCKE